MNCINSTILAIIPARGGSKGIARKNLVPLRGKPLVVHSIEHALQCAAVDRVIVSSEDPEILAVAKAAGAETPFVRPAELAGDTVLDLPVFEHALRWLDEREGYRPELVVHLRPTAPFRKAGWIEEAIRRLRQDPRADSVRSVSPPEKHPYRMFRIGADGYLQALMAHEHPTPYLLRRQDLPPVFFYNCVLDVTRLQTILEKHSMTGDRILPYCLDPEEVIDIDSRRDLLLAEFLMPRLESRG